MPIQNEKRISFDTINPEIWHKIVDTNDHDSSLPAMINSYETVYKVLEPAKRFINSQLDCIQNLISNMNVVEGNDSIVPNKVDGVMVMHLIPLIDMINKPHLKITEIERISSNISLFDSRGSTFRAFVDGFGAIDIRDGLIQYTKIFRNYCIESYTNNVIVDHSKIQGSRYEGYKIPPTSILNMLEFAMSSHLRLFRSLGANPPILIHISFLGMKDVSLILENYPFAQECFYRETELYLPPSVIFTNNEEDDHHDALKEQLNYFWNTFGLSSCPDFR